MIRQNSYLIDNLCKNKIANNEKEVFIHAAFSYFAGQLF
jgi:hypothetical protein